MNRHKTSQVAIATASLLAACGGGGSAGDQSASPTPQSVEIPSAKIAAMPSASAAYELIYQENFDGTSLNLTKWIHRADSVNKYRGGYNLEDNVSVSGGTLKIAFKREDVDGDNVADISGGGIISKNNFGYGYYEARVKLYGGGPGLHQSFWMMGLNNPNFGEMPKYGQVIEIDGFEQDSNSPTGFNNNAHYYLPTHYSINQLYTGSWASVSGGTTNWFTVGYEWLPDNGGTVKFYLNGNLIRTAPFNKTAAFGQSSVWLTALANTDLSGGMPTSLPSNAQMEVDYFRFYGKNLPGANRVTNPGFEFNKSTMDPTHQVGWIKWAPTQTTANLSAATIYTGAEYAHGGASTLWHTNPTSSYVVTTKQNIENIPDGSYKLTAWVKSSGGQSYAAMRVLNYGGAERIVNIPASADWRQITIDNISVTANKALIAFSSDANAGQWIKVDDVVFAQK